MAGRLHAAMKQHDKAVEMLKKVVVREPNNLSAHALLSQSYLELGRLQEAIGEFQRILAMNPEDQSAQQSLRSALDKMRKEGPSAKQAPGAARASAAAAAPPVAPAPTAVAEPPKAAASPVSTAVPAFAAADELAMRGMYDEAVEAYQRILDVDPDNFMARSKLREVYRMRDAIEAPSAPAAGQPVSAAAPASDQAKETQADKISDDEILYLLGLMEATADSGAAAAGAGAGSRAAAAGPAVAVDEPLLGNLEELAPGPRVEFRAAAPAAAVPSVSATLPPPVAEEKVAEVVAPIEAPATKAQAAKAPAAKAPAAKAPAATPPPSVEAVPAVDEGKVREVLARLVATEGMRQAFLVSGERLIATGEALGEEQAEHATTLVRMLSDITRRAAESMKQGAAKQVLIFGTEGMVMVSPAVPGILAAVAGAGVKVGLLRLALNDCLRRLGEVS